MFSFLRRALRYHWDAHASTPANLAAAVVGTSLNNVMFLHGMWLMLFDGKPANRETLPYFLALWGIAATVWGLLNFFTGGLLDMGKTIEEGALEPMLATPRHPLWLIAVSSSHPMALGDILQGLVTFVAVAYVAPLPFLGRAVLALAIVYVAFMAVFILAGSLAFFVARGASVGGFLIESVLSLTVYPSGRMFDGRARYVLYLTPALVTSFLPMEAVDSGSLAAFAKAALGAVVAFGISLTVFRSGVRRYKSGSYVGFTR